MLAYQASAFGDGDPGERPVHEVCVDDFYLGKAEVTVGQFEKFVSATGYQTEAEREGSVFALTYRGWARVTDRNWRNPGFSQTDRHPVVCVSWNDARAFLDWLSKKTGKAVRLPTEAEWEYAARCGGKNYKYGGSNAGPTGNIADEALRRAYQVTFWWEGYDDGFVYTSPVGSFSPNELGLYDMTGNVWRPGLVRKGLLREAQEPPGGQRGFSCSRSCQEPRFVGVVRFGVLPERLTARVPRGLFLSGSGFLDCCSGFWVFVAQMPSAPPVMKMADSHGKLIEGSP
jgi:hypothetical protein